jgi:transcriptional regulator GlxA family with amidase domain
VQVDPAVLYVHDDVWTSAGSAAGIDLCLELVRQDLGAAVANEISRRIVAPPHRDGGQAQFMRYSPGRADRDGHLHAWVRENLADVTVARMAVHAGSSERSLIRAFRARTGMTPQAWLQRERLTAAQELLEGTDLTLEVIARRVGLGTATNLRTQFARTFGVPPSSYRRTFRRASA